MRKNKMMRAASGLLVAVLLTTCVISGTFAKYVTSDNGSDSARVAKWGVNVVMSDDSLFSNTYKTDDTSKNVITNSVVSSDNGNVVAPGTKEANALTFAISGTPEVAVKVDAAMKVNNDVKLAGNQTYPDMTTGGNTSDTFTQAEDYYPVVYTLKKGDTTVATGNLAKIKEYIEKLSGNYEAGSNAENSLAKINGTYTLSWAWKFDEADNTNTNLDKADTLLGDLAAETVTSVDKANYDLNTNFEISITVTQID